MPPAGGRAAQETRQKEELIARLEMQIERKHDRLDEMRLYSTTEPAKLKALGLEQAAVALLEKRLEELKNPVPAVPADQLKIAHLWKSAAEHAFRRRMVQQEYAAQERLNHPQQLVPDSPSPDVTDAAPQSMLGAEPDPEMEKELSVEPPSSDDETSGAGQSGSSTPNSRSQMFLTASERSAAGQVADALQLLAAPKRRHRLALRNGNQGYQAADRADQAMQALEDFRTGKLKKATEGASVSLRSGPHGDLILSLRV
jgi:hypothetical protein